MLDQMQVATIVPSLPALLAHPEFQQGLADAHEEFLGDYAAAPLTEDEMIKEVEMNLSRCVIERDNKLSRMKGWEPVSYFYNLGYVMGTIDKGLTYAR